MRETGPGVSKPEIQTPVTGYGGQSSTDRPTAAPRPTIMAPPRRTASTMASSAHLGARSVTCAPGGPPVNTGAPPADTGAPYAVAGATLSSPP